jgi:hypothetical protein
MIECEVGGRKKREYIMKDETEEMDRGPHYGKCLKFSLYTP